jgi:hypothetical protein
MVRCLVKHRDNFNFIPRKLIGGEGIALEGCDWSASRPDRYTPGERATDTHWLGGWVGRTAGWMQWRREKFANYYFNLLTDNSD